MNTYKLTYLSDDIFLATALQPWFVPDRLLSAFEKSPQVREIVADVILLNGGGKRRFMTYHLVENQVELAQRGVKIDQRNLISLANQVLREFPAVIDLLPVSSEYRKSIFVD
ncbi:hypothetical protein [Xylocopilactobacillus apicola]|uniref:Uncharacterized protein n=1 Tax=Xylocopilactobacillus apicola TaxID=2932184 RepID=A0AAU9D5J5_9LACO|nr:hypothetical protein [Xylocopilactobacillus apicola]BDR59064.1 hypothetical protein XA3_15050 [Xylocopilactobacillus apicola]